MTTIRDLATRTNTQPYEIAAYLDLGANYSDTDEVTPEHEALWVAGIAETND